MNTLVFQIPKESNTQDHFYSAHSLQTGFPYKEEHKIQFSSLLATVQIDASDFDLKIVVLNTNPCQMWKAEFKSAYLEDICRKTGLPKSYSDFNILLKQGLRSLSQDVFVDLLNLSDL